ncbi:uncharacterized protein LOC124302433 [Neodiprion virginianus]|uniref:uncharacterized protein LOC124302433 n=1 Tax=Neodiprion virginianus TaxID=2961670 RepID=UPI001EE6AD17|nr:uncharacterized protein LOC124302433 [Neodiprion virginianus]
MAMTMEYLKTYPTTASGYRIELAKQSRLPDVLKFMSENYHEDEKIGRMLKAGCQTNPDEEEEEEEAERAQEDDDNLVTAVYERSPCLIAVQNGTEEIVGVILTILSRREGEDERNGAGTAELFKSYTFKSKFVKDYYSYLAKMDEETGMHQRYPDAEAVMEFFAIAVHQDHRRKGLAKDLSETALTIAKCIPGLRVVFGYYSSIYSRKVAEKIGMVNLFDFDLSDAFKNDEGEPVFRDVDGDSVVSVMALEIDHA